MRVDTESFMEISDHAGQDLAFKGLTFLENVVMDQ